MPSPIFRIGYAVALIGPWTWAAYDTAAEIPPNYYVKVELQSTAGVDVIWVELVHGDLDTLAAGFPAVTVDQATKTATWQHPNAKGRTIDPRVTINQGSLNGVAQPSYMRSLQSYSVTASGEVRPAVGETDEANRTSGWTSKLDHCVDHGQPTTFRCHKGSLTTPAGAAATTIVTVPPPTADATYMISAYVEGQDTGASAAAYLLSAGFKWDQALGAWTQIGATVASVSLEDVGGWDCTLSISGTDIVLQVLGDVLNNTTWAAQCEVRSLIL